MFNSLKSKIIIPSIGVLLVLMIATIVYASASARGLAASITDERIRTASSMTRAKIDSLDEINLTKATAITSSSTFIGLLEEWNSDYNRTATREELFRFLDERGGGADEFVLIDRDGIVILRTFENRRDDSVRGIPLFDAALAGQGSTVYSSTPELRMGLTSLVPVTNSNGEVIGTISVITDMTRSDFVDRMATAFNAQVTVFVGNERIATTLMDERGQRIVGTELGVAQIIEKVLVQGESITYETVMMGEPIIGYYFPLFGWGGEVVGMFFAGFSNADTIAHTTFMQRILVAIGLWGTVIAASIMFFLTTRALKPLSSLTKTVREVSEGNIDVKINDTNLPKDEIGTLTSDVLGLVDVIKSIVEDLIKLDHEYNVIGDIDFRIDNSKYKNSFKDMINGVNNIPDNIVRDILVLLEALEELNNGNFDLHIHDLPGKKMVLPNAIRATMANLQSVSAEVNAMIKAAAEKGDLSFKIDETKYKGDWREIMRGLNRIANAVDIPLKVLDMAFAEMKQGNFDLTAVDNKINASGLDANIENYSGIFRDIMASFNATIDEVASYIVELEQVLAQMAGGDLRNKIEREYVGSFDLIKRSVNNINSTLSQTMAEISVASEQVLSGAKQISSSAADLANGAQEQASSVEELNATVDMISQQTKRNADNAIEANDLSNKSTVNAREGNEAMRQMLAAMTQIKESSKNISAIIKVIQDIAFQTNLLSLNASVEAARAGEHGRGFSVVADEVRNLAVRSQQSATETTNLIQDSISRVENGSSIAESTSQSLDTIVKNASEVLEIINNIAIASKDQAEAIEQISGGLAQISKVVQSNSAVSEETAAASQELNSQAETLQQLVAYFKL